MRVRKLPKACPCCKADIADFLRTAQENREMADIIARLQRAAREARVSAGIDEAGDDLSIRCRLQRCGGWLHGLGLTEGACPTCTGPVQGVWSSTYHECLLTRMY